MIKLRILLCILAALGLALAFCDYSTTGQATEEHISGFAHELTFRTTDRKNPKSRGYACRIVYFLVN